MANAFDGLRTRSVSIAGHRQHVQRDAGLVLPGRTPDRVHPAASSVDDAAPSIP